MAGGGLRCDGLDGCRRCRQLSIRWAHSCALLVGVGVLVWLMPSYSGSWQKSMCRCRQRWIVLRMWLVSSVTAVAVRPLFYFVMAATGVLIGAASPQLCLRC